MTTFRESTFQEKKYEARVPSKHWDKGQKN